MLRVLNIIDPRLHRSKQGKLVMQSCIWPLHPLEEPLSQTFVGLRETVSVLQVRRCPSHPTRHCLTYAAQADQGPLSVRELFSLVTASYRLLQSVTLCRLTDGALVGFAVALVPLSISLQ